MMAQVLAPSRPHDSQAYSTSGSLLHSSPSRSSLATLPYSQQSRVPSPALASQPRSTYPTEDENASPPSCTQSSSPDLSSSPVFSDPNNGSSKSVTPSTSSLETSGKDSIVSDDDDDGDVEDDDDDHDDDILFPTYDSNTLKTSTSRYAPPESSPDTDQDYSTPTTDSTPPEEPLSPVLPHVADDSEAREEPTRQVDYLSHEWREEDIWSSWKHIVSKRRVYGERSRLENASWRTWAKQKNHLRTVSPERLNWLKDCDVTWLYGPLQQRHPKPAQGSEPPSRLSKNDSFINKKPILKKRSASEIMLQKSISSSSLLKQAAAAVQAQRKTPSEPVFRPVFGRSRSEYGSTGSSEPPNFSNAFPSASSSGIHSPEAGSNKRHIRFDNKVEQCIAVEFKGISVEEESLWTAIQDDTSSEDDLPMMKPTVRRHSSNIPSSRDSFSTTEQKGIAMLPATTLKDDDGKETQQQQEQQSPSSLLSGLLRSRKSGSLQSSSSQETLRPADPSTNFLIDEGEYDDEESALWRPSGAFAAKHRPEGGPMSSHLMPRVRIDAAEDDEDHDDEDARDRRDDDRSGLRRTNSGMFMPYDESEEESVMNTGLFGRVVDSVNTARDIAHVIWNVGWRK